MAFDPLGHFPILGGSGGQENLWLKGSFVSLVQGIAGFPRPGAA
jgi:hypothetical protein